MSTRKISHGNIGPVPHCDSKEHVNSWSCIASTSLKVFINQHFCDSLSAILVQFHASTGKYMLINSKSSIAPASAGTFIHPHFVYMIQHRSAPMISHNDIGPAPHSDIKVHINSGIFIASVYGRKKTSTASIYYQ